MLNRLLLHKFKRFREVELGQGVVLVGHRNSGETTVLQAPTPGAGRPVGRVQGEESSSPARADPGFCRVEGGK